MPGTGPMSTQLLWTPEAYEAFDDVKMALQSAPALGIPDPQRPFTQTVNERNGCTHCALVVLRPASRPWWSAEASGLFLVQT